MLIRVAGKTCKQSEDCLHTHTHTHTLITIMMIIIMDKITGWKESGRVRIG